jgi:hypothetical protein
LADEPDSEPDPDADAEGSVISRIAGMDGRETAPVHSEAAHVPVHGEPGGVRETGMRLNLTCRITIV